MPTETAADWTKFWKLIKDIKFAMFTAHASDGHMHSRPMTTQNKSDDRANVLWFFMSRSSEPVLDIARDASVNVAYADPGSDAYVSVAGRARLVDDIAKKKALWNTGAQAWFPGGVTDPDLALIAVTIEHVDYWDVDTNKMVQLFKITKAAMTGVPPKMGEHRELHSR
jgi:general stress protein 26